MAWIKVPPDHHPLFRAALPKDPRVSTMNMFGAVCGLINGNMFGGLFGRSAIVRLSPTDQEAALALDGAGPFDPMGNGRTMRDTVMLPETVMDEPQELANWLRRGLEFTQTLPPKAKKAKPAAKAKAPAKPAAKAKPTAKPVPKAKPVAKKAPAKKAPAKKPAVKKAPAKKAPAKKR